MTAKRTQFGWQLATEHGRFFGATIRDVEYQAEQAKRAAENQREKYEARRQMILDEQRIALEEQSRA